MSTRRAPQRSSAPPVGGAAPALAARASARDAWLVGVAVFIVGVLAYANTLGHGFVWDDPIWLEQKIRFYRGPLDAFFEPTFMPMRQVYRPLSQLTYWIDQVLWWRNSFGFHLTSVVLHAANGVLVLALARALGFALVPAAVAALVFLVHPIQPESVAWITNRVDAVATLFVIVALIAALQPATGVTLAVVALASFLAAAGKETGCVVPALVLATLLLDPRTVATSAQNATARARRPWLAAAVSALGVLPYFFLRPRVAGTGIDPSTLGADALSRLVGSFGYQVERLFFPVGFWPYLAHVPMDGRTLALAAAGALAAAFALLAPDASGRRRFAVLWILIAAALPVIVVLADFSSTPVAEHRLYLATVGLALLVAVGLSSWAQPPRAVMAAAAFGVVALTAVTVDRNRFWRDDLTLWTAVTERMSTEPLPYLNLGLALADAKRSDEAVAAYRRALALTPSDITRQRTSINLGLLLVERDLDEAERLFTEALAVSPHAIAHRGLGMAAGKRAQQAAAAGDAVTAARYRERARAALERALGINPRYYQAHFTLASVLYESGQYRAALAAYQRVVELAGDTPAGRNAAAAAAELGAWLAAHPEAP